MMNADHERLNQLLSDLLKIPVDSLHDSLRLDRSAFGSSIHLHRFYARLAQDGFDVSNYQGIFTLSDLKNRLDRTAEGNQPICSSKHNETEPDAPGIGIDIESIKALPKVSDFRNESFYILNFSPREISYCLIQKDPYASFTGLFAAKEALFKASSSVKNMPFNQLEINHTIDGKPVYPGYTISISHAGEMAVAVVYPANVPGTLSIQNYEQSVNTKNEISFWLSVTAIVLSLITLVLLIRNSIQ